MSGGPGLQAVVVAWKSPDAIVEIERFITDALDHVRIFLPPSASELIFLLNGFTTQFVCGVGST